MREVEVSIGNWIDRLWSLQVEQGSQLRDILTSMTKEVSLMLPQNPIQPASQDQVISPMKKPDTPVNQEIREESTFYVDQDINAASGVEGGLKNDDRELSMDHITVVHKLLTWPSIKALLLRLMKYRDNAEPEVDCGLVRGYGRGEGNDTNEGSQQGQKPCMENMYTLSWDEGLLPTGSPSGATWKAPGKTTPINPSTSVITTEHGIEESGTFTTDPDTVRRLQCNYMKHVHKLHPFLDQKDLEKKIDIFIGIYCPARTTDSHNSSRGHQKGTKRKRSKRIELSVDNAVILLVLALGSINEYHDCAVPCPMPRCCCKERNTGIIRGSKYYGYAAQILGSLQGANCLPHVQAALLAGLYVGQLAHPFQSHGWINQAARACQVLVRPGRYYEMNDGLMKDLCGLAYWTCLQLESDILTEFDLPASGISRLEGMIAVPKGLTLNLSNETDISSQKMMFVYSARIYLQKILNKASTYLCKVGKQPCSLFKVQRILSINLQQWRNSLPDMMQWEDSGPSSRDIDIVQMRVKYYRARYIIHRPLLYHALHIASQPESVGTFTAASGMSVSHSQQVSSSMIHSQQVTSIARLHEGSGPVQSSTTTPVGKWTSLTFRDLSPALQQTCKICIDSAILSMKTLDGIESRPVESNIFGTAHAQFGNMLVLSATYVSSLSELVDSNVLKQLLKRTIHFLRQRQHILPSLRADAKILMKVYEEIFSEAPVSISFV
ncbi:fungal specific transcription factor domain-containing protein [Aspergillus chevalieri]|uniref:Uncharacterized protein n=1 Tax=Aspergillus chevalieri TaxID=182096 RepID=A0A7R7VGS6_ASPCH|nr:uncharacterized protein ACHE_10945S [Aspergillus chevalieri]BCR83543.1 hypothetical protein ACHE_10945S [Aspergillus chevalieri]